MMSDMGGEKGRQGRESIPGDGKSEEGGTQKPGVQQAQLSQNL